MSIGGFHNQTIYPSMVFGEVFFAGSASLHFLESAFSITYIPVPVTPRDGLASCFTASQQTGGGLMLRGGGSG